MSGTKSIGIRLPKKLWDLVKTAEPNKTYSEIVGCALQEKYGFKPQTPKSDNKVYTEIDDIDNRVDVLFDSVHTGVDVDDDF